MNKFFIERVTAKGDNVKDAVVTLQPGLNIIQGHSNTGKTCISKCIAFCFGSSTKPFDESLGYDTIELLLNTPKGRIAITRTLGKNQVDVSTTIQGFEDGKYDIEYKKDGKWPVLNDLLLASIGIEESHTVPTNKYFDKKRLTWRTMLKMLMFSNIDIASETSVMIPIQYTEQTYCLSTLLFLLTGRDFSEADAQTKKEIRDASRHAVEEYVNKNISAVAEKKRKLEKELDVFSDINVEKEMKAILDDLRNTEHQISASVEQSKDILQRIVQLQERYAECNLLQSRYKTLRSQYLSDIKRLSFIVDGEVELAHVPDNTKCPFCEGSIPVRNKQSYIKSAQAELSRIMAQMNGLEATEQDLTEEKESIQTSLSELEKRRTELEDLIDKKLQPKADSLQNTLNGYRAYIQLQNELKVISDFALSWETDLRNLPDENESKLEYHPKEYLDKGFQERMDAYIKNALEECKYDNLTTTRFNITDFDVEVNGHKKATNHGQGYCSYLNTVVALVFREYLHKHAKYDPGFLIIDTPLLGLDQGVNDAAPESMRTALFTYFTTHQDFGQIVILENLLHMPDIDYEATGANLITFTRDKNHGRYGFLDYTE